jgi:hypothetical protein
MNIITSSVSIEDIRISHKDKAKLVVQSSSMDFARAFARAMISNKALRVSPELSMLQRSACYLTSGADAGFAVTVTGCIVAMFDSSNDLDLQTKLVDDAATVGGWRFAD